MMIILHKIIEVQSFYSSCNMLYEWNDFIFYSSPLCIGKTLVLLFMAKIIDKTKESCSKLLIFVNYIISWIVSVTFIIGFSELYYEKHEENKFCKNLQSFDIFFIIMEAIQVLFITLFGFYIFYSIVKNKLFHKNETKLSQNLPKFEKTEINSPESSV